MCHIRAKISTHKHWEKFDIDFRQSNSCILPNFGAKNVTKAYVTMTLTFDPKIYRCLIFFILHLRMVENIRTSIDRRIDRHWLLKGSRIFRWRGHNKINEISEWINENIFNGWMNLSFYQRPELTNTTTKFNCAPCSGNTFHLEEVKVKAWYKLKGLVLFIVTAKYDSSTLVIQKIWSRLKCFMTSAVEIL